MSELVICYTVISVIISIIVYLTKGFSSHEYLKLLCCLTVYSCVILPFFTKIPSLIDQFEKIDTSFANDTVSESESSITENVEYQIEQYLENTIKSNIGISCKVEIRLQNASDGKAYVSKAVVYLTEDKHKDAISALIKGALDCNVIFVDENQ